MVPEEYGGVRDFRFNAVLTEEIVRAGASGLGFTVHCDINAAYFIDLGTPEQHARWLPIVRERRLAAVIDFSALGLGDPAPDLAPAWNLFDHGTRTIFRDVTGYDDATWARGKGWVLAPALQGLRYYRRTRPDFVAAARQQIDAVLADAA